MIKPIVKENKVVFGPCRLSYTHVFAKYAPDGDTDNGKYMTNVLIPKDEAETIKNTQLAEELALPPVKIHCSVLAEDAIKAAVRDYKQKKGLL